MNYVGVCVIILVITACIAVLMKVLSKSVLDDIDKRRRFWARENSKLFREEFDYVITEGLKFVKEATETVKEENEKM